MTSVQCQLSSYILAIMRFQGMSSKVIQMHFIPCKRCSKIGAPIFTWKFIGQVTLAKNLVFVPLGNSNIVKWYLVTYLNGCLLRSGYLFIYTSSNSGPLNNIPQMHIGRENILQRCHHWEDDLGGSLPLSSSRLCMAKIKLILLRCITKIGQKILKYN